MKLQQAPSTIYCKSTLSTINPLLILFLLVAFTPSVNATLIKYKITGTISNTSGTSLSLGDPFSGFWVVDTEAVGSPIHTTIPGKKYQLIDMQLEVGSVLLKTNINQNSLFLSTVQPPREFFSTYYPWTTGFSSDYNVQSDFQRPGIEAWGVKIERFNFVFSFDGNDIWNDYQIPTAVDLLNHPKLVDFGISISSTSTSLGISGGIDSLTATVIPIPAGLFYTGLALLALFRKRFN